MFARAKTAAGARGRGGGTGVQPAERPGRPAQVEHEDGEGSGRCRLLQAGGRGGCRVLQVAGREGGGDQPRRRLGGRHRGRRARGGTRFRQGLGAEVLRPLRLRQGREPPVGTAGEGQEGGRVRPPCRLYRRAGSQRRPRLDRREATTGGDTGEDQRDLGPTQTTRGTEGRQEGKPEEPARSRRRCRPRSGRR